MPQFRIRVPIWRLAGLIALFAAAATARAQDDVKTKDVPKAAEAKPTPWPPKNTEKQEFKREGDKAPALILHAPKTWTKAKPKSRLRLAEFSIPPAKGDSLPVELAVFYFGEGGGGGVPANVERWINQFQAKGRKAKVVWSEEGHQGLYVLVDVKGIYNMPDGPPIRRKTKPLPNARMLAAIIAIRWKEKEADKTRDKIAFYFLKMAGSEKTVSANEEAFRLAFGAANRSQEKPLEVKEQ